MAISTDPTDKSRALIEKLGLSYDLYADENGALARRWGVFDSEHDFNLAATFLVARGGELRYRYLGTNKADRPSAATLLELVRSL